MKKNFFKFSLILVIVTALLSVAFSIVYFIASGSIEEGDSFLNFLHYVKKGFDLLAVFTGYVTILYGFSRLDFKNGLISLGTFSISFLMSFIFQVIGTCTMQSDFTSDFMVFTIYYAFGSCFITQMVPALVVALVSYLVSKDCNTKIKKLFSWSNPIQRALVIITLIILGLNAITLLAFDTLPFLIECGFLVTVGELVSIIMSYVETVIIYLVVQFLFYTVGIIVYDKYLEKHPD